MSEWDKDTVYGTGSVVTYKTYQYTYVNNAPLSNQNPITSTYDRFIPGEGTITLRCWLPQAVRQGNPNIYLNYPYGNYLPEHLQFVRGAGPALDSNIQQGGPPIISQYYIFRGAFQYIKSVQVVSYNDKKDGAIEPGSWDRSWFDLPKPSKIRGPYYSNDGSWYEYNDNKAYTLSEDHYALSKVLTVPVEIPTSFQITSATTTAIEIVISAAPGVPPSTGYVPMGTYEVSAFIGWMSTFAKTFKYQIKYSERERANAFAVWGPWQQKVYEGTISTGSDIRYFQGNQDEFKRYANGTTKQLKLDSYEFLEMQTPMLVL